MKYYRNVIQIEILSNTPLNGTEDLAAINYAISEGDASGMVTTVTGDEEISAGRMAGLLASQGSDPSFLISGEDENEDPGPDLYDGYITLDGSDAPRWGYYVRLENMSHGGPFPSRGIAVYELAAAMAERGSFPAAWVNGEHGPACESIDAEIRAHHDAGGTDLLPLAGVRYAPGDVVLYEGETWTVRKDYGTALGAVLHDADAPELGGMLAQHNRLAPVTD